MAENLGIKFDLMGYHSKYGCNFMIFDNLAMFILCLTSSLHGIFSLYFLEALILTVDLQTLISKAIFEDIIIKKILRFLCQLYSFF